MPNSSSFSVPVPPLVCEIGIGIDRGQPMKGHQREDQLAMVMNGDVRLHDERSVWLARERLNDTLNFRSVLHRRWGCCDADESRCILY